MWFDGETQKLREEKERLEKECTELKAELELYKEIAALSDKEALVVLNAQGKAIFFNTRGESITNKDAVIRELSKNSRNLLF